MTTGNLPHRTVGLVRVNLATRPILDSLKTALDLIRFKASPPINKVVIKPNLCYYWHASTGYTTDPRIVESLIDYLRKEFGNPSIAIAEADATAMRTAHSFGMLGYTELAEKKGVELLNLSAGQIVEQRVRVGKKEITFKVPSTLLDADLFINVPKLKTMKATKISCALKNIFGCIASPRKVKYHPLLPEAIVGINKILRPHLTIVDGIIGLGRFPARLNLLIASTDPFAADWVAAKIMGYTPSSVKFLRIAKEEQLLANDVVVAGETIKEFQRLFPNHAFMAAEKEALQIKLLRAYCRITGDVLPPVMEHSN